MLLLYYVYILTIIIVKMVMGLSEGCKASEVYMSETESFNFSKIENLIVFGDSLSDVKTNFNDMTYTGVNCALGDNWPLQLINLKEMTLWNFAIGGSVIDKKILPIKSERSSFFIQYDLFKNKLIKDRDIYECNWNSNNSLFIIWFGTNDILYMDRTKYKNNSNEIIESVINLLFNTLDELYELGGRNFVFFNIHSLYKLPSNHEPYNHIDGNELKNNCITFNDCIQDNALKFHNKFNDTNVFVYNVKEEIEYIQNNYKLFNFANADKNYKEEYNKDDTTDINNYIMADNLHFTYKTHEIIAKDINSLLSSNSSSLTSSLSSNSLFINIAIILMNSFLLINILF